jgi:hypothetical protein
MNFTLLTKHYNYLISILCEFISDHIIIILPSAHVPLSFIYYYFYTMLQGGLPLREPVLNFVLEARD